MVTPSFLRRDNDFGEYMRREALLTSAYALAFSGTIESIKAMQLEIMPVESPAKLAGAMILSYTALVPFFMSGQAGAPLPEPAIKNER